ncbi:MAG: glycosyltransferase family 2 protein [Acidobacteriota bacterium]
MNWWLTFIAGWVLALCWMASGFRMVRFFSSRTLDRCAGKLFDPETWPSVSVIFAARNEANTIEPALRSLAGMDYPNMEVIAVNDRSSDGTGQIVERIGAEAANVRFLHINHLPENWLGKCHALHRGALQASGDLLLFTDGDVRFAADTLRLAVRFLKWDRCDHLVLCPRMLSRNYWEDAVKGFFALAYFTATRAWAVSGPSKRAYIGIGAFNLVSRAAYERIGGHESLRLEVADDLMLGKRIKQHGYRQNVLIAPKHLRLHWVEGVGGFVQGLEKNAFASLDFSILRLLGATGLMILFNAVPYLGLLMFRDVRISGYLAAVLVMHTVFGWCTSRNGKGWRLLPVYPIAAGIFFWTMWRSALVTLRRGGVLWRDTFYPVRILKRK